MSRTTIHQIVGIRGITLLVFYNDSQCWQFRVITAGGTVFGERKLYYTHEAAERAGEVRGN